MSAFDPTQPFILFDDARQDSAMRLYYRETARIEAAAHADVVPALNAARKALASGMHVAGWLGYEAGRGFEQRLAQAARPPAPLLSFGIYDRAYYLSWAEIEMHVAARRAAVGALSPQVSEARHAAAVARILDYILAGDIYQANLTLTVGANYRGHPLALYARLRRAQRMPHGAVIHDGDGHWRLSASPELLFRLQGGRITARPMKGTARRLPSAAADAAAAHALAADAKNRAENLMITDLIRNDLSRVAAAGSVRVENPFAVEHYPTVHQMVTTIIADLRQDHDAADIVSAMFPCGSITGAPKIRASEVIDEVEWRTRGIYTGSIGWMAPGGDAEFNVAIRTAELTGGRLTMGVGAGIVADSSAAAEWCETLDKAAFLNMQTRPFHLFETMYFDPNDGIALLNLHLDRLSASAQRLGFVFDRHEVRNLMQVMIGRERGPKRVKLTLAADGTVGFALTDMPAPLEGVTVAIVPLPVAVDDWRLYHKTSDREFYDDARKAAGTDEVVFTRPDGRLTEGSFTNLFVPGQDGLRTPRAENGLLPGILRRSLLLADKAVEADLTINDLDDGFFVGNALRGLIPAKLVAA